MDQLLGRNKRRLAMAMYARGAQDGGVSYHTALLLLPKDTSDVSKRDAFRYHVKNLIVEGKPTWVFSPEADVEIRTFRVYSMAYLGKISISESALRTRLESVPVMQDDPLWFCHHWVWAAIKLLRDEGVLEATHLTPEDLWNIQYDFTRRAGCNYEAPLPCLDKDGNEIDSPIGPLDLH